MSESHFKFSRHGTRWAMIAMCALSLAGCAVRQPAPDIPSVAPAPAASPVSCEEPQREIARLQQLLADKEAEISNLRAQQQEQGKLLKETTSQAARAEVKLRRFATEADAASLLAQVEVAMAKLRSTPGAERDAAQQGEAQRILDGASAAFAKGDYDASVDLATQARQFIDMLADHRNGSGADKRATSEVPFKAAIALRMKVDGNLRRQPRANAAVLGVLQKAAPVTARAYQGEWLQVQTEDGNLGWVLNSLVEAR